MQRTAPQWRVPRCWRRRGKELCPKCIRSLIPQQGCEAGKAKSRVLSRKRRPEKGTCLPLVTQPGGRPHRVERVWKQWAFQAGQTTPGLPAPLRRQLWVPLDGADRPLCPLSNRREGTAPFPLLGEITRETLVRCHLQPRLSPCFHVALASTFLP